MVSPEEVEQVLMSHPQVDDAAVVGTDDVEWGEETRALVVTTLPAAPPGSGEGEPPAEADIIECGIRTPARAPDTVRLAIPPAPGRGQARAASKAATLRVSLLNSTAIRWIG